MSLAGSVTYWDKARKNASSKETWLIKLYYDDEGATDFIGLCDRDITITNVFYHGVVLDFGELTEKIDLLKSKASIGNVDITCVNKYANKTFAEELWPTGQGASAYYYINRKVLIYSLFGDTTALTDTRLIYEGRLFNLTQNEHEITLHIEQKQPQDFIKIPNSFTAKGTPVPVVYGNYTVNATTQSSRDFCSSKALWPVPIEWGGSATVVGVVHETISASGRLHLYEENPDLFVPLTDSDGATYNDTSQTYHGVAVMTANGGLYRGLKIKPAAKTGNTGSITNPDDAFDLPSQDDSGYSTQADIVVSDSAGGITAFSLHGISPEITGILTNFEIQVRYNLSMDSGDAFDTVRLRNDTYGRTDTIATLGAPGAGSDTLSSAIDMIGDYQTANNAMPDTIEMRASAEHGGVSGICVCSAEIHDIHLLLDASLDFTDADAIEESKRVLREIKFCYSGADGFDADFTDGSGSTATLPHEIFRDMLDRFAGFDVGNSNMTNYTALDDDRDGTDDADTSWDVRMWVLEPVPLQDVLDRLQFEGGFIYKYHPSGGKFIWVEDSYSSGDVAHDITAQDYSGISVTLSPFSEIITDVTWNYQKHPATGKFIGDSTYSTYTNSSARTNYWPSIASEENKTIIDLEYLVDRPYDSGTDTNPNSCIALYYDNIWGDPKTLVSVDLTNPDMFDLEVGDIVTFDEQFTQFGKTTTVYFMVIETRRVIGGLSIVAREVYDA